jgi:hypothetical protein
MESGSIIFRRPLFAKSKLKDTMGLDSVLLLYLWTMAGGPTVASIIDFVSMWTTTSTWTVEITSKMTNSKTNFTDDILNRTFAQQCNQKLEEMIQHALIFGWVGIQYTVKDGIDKDKVTGGDVILNILHPYEYEPRFKMTKRGNKKWIAYSRMNEVGDNQEPVPYSRIFMFRQPEPITGKPTSPLMFALRSIFQYDEGFALQQIIANKRAFPVWVYKAEIDKLLFPNDAQRPDPNVQPGPNREPVNNRYATDPSGAPEDAGLTKVSSDFIRDWNARHAFRKIAESLDTQSKQHDNLTLQMFQLPSRNRDTLEEFVEKGSQNPTLPSKNLAPGLVLDSNVPEAKSVENFDTLEEVLKIQICTLLGVPVEFIFGGGRFASDIALNRKIMETRTTRLHAWLGTVLAEIFLDIHFVDIYDKVESFSEEMGITEALKIAGKVSRETYLTAGIMMKDNVKALIQKDLLISVHFAETTSASEESLLRAVQTGVIDLEKYQQLMLATLGIPQSAKAKLEKNKAKQLLKHIQGLDEAQKKPGVAGVKAKTTPAKTKTDKVRPAGEQKKPAKKAKTSDSELRAQEKKQKAKSK